MNVLLVEDNKEIQDSLRDFLKGQGFVVDVADDGEAAIYKTEVNAYDLLILDIGLPKKDGRQVCAHVRQAGKHMPIIILSVKSEIADKAELLHMGADDYVVKPFSFTELLARIHACLRRPASLMPSVLKINGIELNTRARTLTVYGEPVHVTPKEFFLLEYLLTHQGRVVSRQEILEHVWDINADLFTNTIETHIASLRKKIKGSKELIHTVSSGGYKIE